MIFRFLRQRAGSFVWAWAGIRNLWAKEQNTRIHMFFTAAVLIAGIILKISALEWALLFLTISSVWAAEAFNAAIERNVDLVTLEKKPLAKEAKDLAAGGVLILAAGSVVIGVLIFLPKLLALLKP